MQLGTKSMIALAVAASVVGAAGYQLYTWSLTAKSVATYRAPISEWPSYGPEFAPSGAHGMFPSLSNEEALGQDLFNDLRLSKAGDVACKSCHMGSNAFADVRAFSLGDSRQEGDRNAPTLLGAHRRLALFWDGRVASLEEQMWEPLLDPKEMANESRADVIAKIADDQNLEMRFRAVYGAPLSEETFTQALAAYLRTLEWETDFDRFLSGNQEALTNEQVHGLAVFRTSGCMACHSGPDLTDEAYRALLPLDGDLGRGAITGLAEDMGAFRTPSLRHVGKTAPYFHDGRTRSLAEAITLHPDTPELSETDLAALVSFLQAL